jgi:hypothetical protein
MRLIHYGFAIAEGHHRQASLRYDWITRMAAMERSAAGTGWQAAPPAGVQVPEVCLQWALASTKSEVRHLASTMRPMVGLEKARNSNVVDADCRWTGV